MLMTPIEEEAFLARASFNGENPLAVCPGPASAQWSADYNLAMANFVSLSSHDFDTEELSIPDGVYLRLLQLVEEGEAVLQRGESACPEYRGRSNKLASYLYVITGITGGILFGKLLARSR